MANRLAHIVHGNVSMPTKLIEMKGNETTWEVTGSRGKHVVWLKIGSPRQSACACKGYISSGTCGHIQCAVEQAKIMNLIDKRAIEFDEVSIATAKGAAVLRSMGKHDAPRSPLCFSGVLRKAQEKLAKAGSLDMVAQGSGSCFKGFGKKKTPQPAIQDVPGEDNPAVLRDAGDTLAVRNDAGDAKDIHFVKDGEAFDWMVGKLEDAKQGSEILIRAYSFDQPTVVASLKQAMERGAHAKLVADRLAQSTTDFREICHGFQENVLPTLGKICHRLWGNPSPILGKSATDFGGKSVTDFGEIRFWKNRLGFWDKQASFLEKNIVYVFGKQAPFLGQTGVVWWKIGLVFGLAWTKLKFQCFER